MLSLLWTRDYICEEQTETIFIGSKYFADISGKNLFVNSPLFRALLLRRTEEKTFKKTIEKQTNKQKITNRLISYRLFAFESHNPSGFKTLHRCFSVFVATIPSFTRAPFFFFATLQVRRNKTILLPVKYK